LAASSTTICASGLFSVNVNFSFGDGAKNIIAAQTDAAGNSGSDNRSFIRDSTGPAITIASPAAGTVARNGVTISGACETGLPITISGSGVAASSAATCTAGSYSSAITFSNGEGDKDVTVSQTDGAGNSGS